MPNITEQEKQRRRAINESVNGTQAMEGLFPDAETKALQHRYETGELTLEEFSSAMTAHAMDLVKKHQRLAEVA